MAIDWGQTFKNATPITPNAPPTPGVFSRIGAGIKQGLKNAVTMPAELGKGIITGFGQMGAKVVGTGVRGIEALPSEVKGLGQVATSPNLGYSLAHPLDPVLNAPGLNQAEQIQKQPIFGQPTIQGSTIPQNLGSAAQWASLIVPGTKLGTIAQSAIAGGLFQGGTEATNPNATGASILENTGIGAGTGAATAGTLELGGKLLDRTPTTTPETFSSRTQDATPSYEMVKKSGDLMGKVQAPLEEPGKLIPRVNEAQKGLKGFGERTINTSAQEHAIGQELDKLPNYPDKGTALEKGHAVQDAISSEAENMRKQVQAEDKVAPLNKKAKDIVTKNVLDNMNRQARDVVMSRGHGIEGDAMDRAGTVVGRYAQDTAEALNNYNGTREGILDLRQAEDKIYKAQRGKAAFGDNNWNALDDMHSKIRDYLNEELHSSTTSVDTRMSLQKQTKLYRASDVLEAKAHAEGINEFQTWAKNHPELYRNLKRVATGVAIGTAIGGSGYSVGKKIQKSLLNAGK